MELGQKCSSKKHKDFDAIKYCPECKKYLCNKCIEYHSTIFEDHELLELNKENKNVFLGFCTINNHNNKLNYYCKDHNELVCVNCISKIKTEQDGQHTDCNVCKINDIINEKRNNLSNNIKTLENLSQIIENSIKELKIIFEEINKNKEELKLEIQKVFTKLRTELNIREDDLLLEVDQFYEKNYFKEDQEIFKNQFIDKIKTLLEKGKIIEKEWDNNENKNSLVNDCINIEKMNFKINELNNNINNYKLNNNKINFYCKSDEYINLIKNFGYLSTEDKINDLEVCIEVNNFNPDKVKYIKQISNNFYNYASYCYDGLCYFVSKNKENILAFIDKNSEGRSIIFYDIDKNNEIKKFNNAHNSYILTIKHYNWDEYDLIISTSYNNDIKLWNFNDGSSILLIQNIFTTYKYVFSACLIFDEKNFKIYCVGNTNNYIKIYNSNGTFIKEFGNSNECRCYIDSFIIDNKKYLITGGNCGVHVYNYPELSEYFCFRENNDTKYHNYAKIIKVNNNYKLIDSSYGKEILIWNFFNKNLITKINTTSELYGFTVINKKYLLIGANDNNIKLFDIEKNILIKDIPKHTSYIIGIKAIRDINNNNYLVSYSSDNNLYLWGFE